jgi:response regulator NasT
VSDSRQPDSLRVLVADGRLQRLQHVTGVIESLGHTVVAEATDVGLVALLTSENLPDVAVVCVDESSEQALHLIRQIVKESSCPVIALLNVEDADFVNRAAQIGVFAYIVNANPEQLQSAFGIALRRFAEYHGLEGAFYRRAITERAKGILMERHRIDEHAAFQLLRDQSRRTNTPLVAIAQSISDAHLLLSDRPDDGGQDEPSA